MHRNDVFGDDVENFHPKRWIDMEERFKAHNLSLSQVYTPFLNSNIHNCLGKLLAELESALLISLWTKLFDLERIDKGKITMKATLQVEGLKVKLKRRKNL